MYVETSAAAKLLVEEEPESAALSKYLDDLVANEVVLASGMLLDTELRRLAVRSCIYAAVVRT